MPVPIQLIVGLGNPGIQYAMTRHNVGMWFVDMLAKQFNLEFKQESKFFGGVSQIRINSTVCYLLKPTTYMNESGKSVSAFARFYKISPEAILVAHDELDFSTGIIRLKENGGHGGHNGLRNIIQHLHQQNFLRLRIGIGHPGQKDRVTPYVLDKPSRQDEARIIQAIDLGLSVIPDLVSGEIQKAFRFLHE